MQQVSWSMNGEIRDSKCTIDENRPSEKAKNYILEEYGTKSKCFLHEKEWSVYTDRCQARITVSKTVGCYQVSLFLMGLLIIWVYINIIDDFCDLSIYVIRMKDF